MAVGLLHGRADRGAYVREEVPGADVVGQLVQAAVVPRRLDAAKPSRLRSGCVVPAWIGDLPVGPRPY